MTSNPYPPTIVGSLRGSSSKSLVQLVLVDVFSSTNDHEVQNRTRPGDAVQVKAIVLSILLSFCPGDGVLA